MRGVEKTVAFLQKDGLSSKPRVFVQNGDEVLVVANEAALSERMKTMTHRTWPFADQGRTFTSALWRHGVLDHVCKPLVLEEANDPRRPHLLITEGRSRPSEPHRATRCSWRGRTAQPSTLLETISMVIWRSPVLNCWPILRRRF